MKPVASDTKSAPERIESDTKLTPLTDPSVRGVLVDDGQPTRDAIAGKLYQGGVGNVWQATVSCEMQYSHQPLKLRPASEFGVARHPSTEFDNHHNAAKCPYCTDNGKVVMVKADELEKLKAVAARGEPGLKKLPEGARVFVPDGPRRGPKVREYFFDPIWGHGVFQALRDYDDGDVNVQVCKLLDPALYAIPDGGERIPDDTALHAARCEAIGWQAEAERRGERIKELEAELDAAIGELSAERDLCDKWELANREAERLRKAIGDAAYTLATGGFAGAIAAQQMLLAALSPSPAPAAESQGNAQHHSEGAKILKGGSGSSAAESEGERKAPDPEQLFNEVVAALDQRVKARLAACEERCRELEAGIRAQLGPLDQDQQTEVIARSLRSLLAPKAGGEDGAQS